MTMGRRSMHQRRTRLLPAIWGSVVNTVVVALVIPLRIAAWAAGGQGVGCSAKRLRVLTAGVTIAAYVVTGVTWYSSCTAASSTECSMPVTSRAHGVGALSSEHG